METPGATHFSLNSATDLVKEEGWENEVYADIRGLDTIGVGHLLSLSERMSGKIRIGEASYLWGEGLPDQLVFALFAQDIAYREAVLRRLVNVPLKQNQFDALLMFVYNIGEGAFANSTLLRLLNQREYTEVPDQMRRWVYAGGHIIEGLAARREREAALWCGGRA